MKDLTIFSVLLATVLLSGCINNFESEVVFMSKIHEAIYTDMPVNIDGILDDPIWQQAPSYPLCLSKDKIENGEILKEQGNVKFAWDDKNFYLAVDFKDSDIIAQGQEDQMHHYRYGDVCELFLKPKNEIYYWELYATPASRKSSFFWPSRGYLGLPDCLEKYSCGLKVAAQCNGTMNNWQDKDTGWTAEMAMPIKDLEAYGYKFGPDQEWTILVGRYNYSRYLDPKELSMTPQLSKTSYHLYEEYAELKLVKSLEVSKDIL